MVVQRTDRGTLGNAERTPQGGLRIPARPTRTGVFYYVRADGGRVGELRHPDDVFASESLATLRHATVTDGHPARPVTPDTYREVAIGHVTEQVASDGAYVSAPVLIQDAAAIQKIEARKRSDLSCGYSCDIDPEQGEYNGERYDQRQRRIRYNHVAILPPGAGRAGREVALRLDSSGNQLPADDPPSKPKETPPMPKYRIDGVDYDTSSQEFIQALERKDEKDKAERDALASKLATTEGERDAARKDAKESADKLAAIESAKLVADVLDRARPVLGKEYKADGKTAREIMVDALKADDKAFDDKDRSDEYVQAYFDARLVERKREDSGIEGFRRNARKAQELPREEAREDAESELGPREEMMKRNAEAHRQPLAKTNRRAS